MAAIDIIQFRSPELSASPDVNNYIALADSQTSQTAFGTGNIGTLGTKRDLAVALRAMHLMTKKNTDASGGGTGVIKSESEGQLSREYAIDFKMAAKFPDLIQTGWGRELIDLIQSSVVPVMNRMG